MAGKTDTFWRHVRHDARFYVASLRAQIRAAAALRLAFALQVIGMIINNFMLMAAWLFFFAHFGTVNGWGMADFAAMQGTAMIAFGVVIGSTAGLTDLGRHVDTGSFDSFLTRPSSVVGQVSSSNVDVTVFGDIALGIALVVWYIVTHDPGLLSLVLTAVAIASGMAVLWCFAMLLPASLAFYFFDSYRLTRHTAFMFLDSVNYPTGVLKGLFRLFFLFIMPSLLVGVVPIDTIRGINWEWALLSVVIAAVWVTFSLWFFKRAVHRYESANMIGAR